MAKDINNVTDDISLVMREVIDATENAIVLETALQLHKGSNTNSTKDYIKKQQSTKSQFDKRLDSVSNKAKQFMFNVADNIGAYTGTNTSDIKKEINKGMKMLVKSAKGMQNQTLKKVSRLERYATSATYVPNIDNSIIQATKEGIDKGLPVTYKNGRKVSYKAYMEMAVRTGIQQEIGNRQLETGANANIVFWIVNEFDDCADDHAQYQGKIYYDERYRDFPLRDNIKDAIGAFIKSRQMLSIQSVRDQAPYLTTRPNCRHKMKPVAIDQVMQESLDSIKDSLNLRQASYRPQNYDLTKQQRYNERQIRTYKQREATFRELYKKTNNKDYLIQAQKEKRKLMLWQKKQREFIDANPSLFRDYERESTKVLLQDLGLTKKKIQVDPNLPPTPIAGTPPQQPPSQDIQMNDVVKEHLEIPEQKLDDMFPITQSKPLHQVIKGERKIENHFKYNPIEDAETSKQASQDIKPFIYEQNFNGNPRVVKKDEFESILKETPHLLIRTYGHENPEQTKKFRDEMEFGEFYVDNTGGAMFGRGMYFYTFNKEDYDLETLYNEPTIDPNNDDMFMNASREQRAKLRALENISKFHINGIIRSNENIFKGKTDKEVLKSFGRGKYNDNIRLDVVAVDPQAKIAKLDEIEEEFILNYLEKIPKEEKNAVTEYMHEFYTKEKAYRLHRLEEAQVRNQMSNLEDELFEKAYGRKRTRFDGKYSLEDTPEREKFRLSIGFGGEKTNQADKRYLELKKKQDELSRKDVRPLTSKSDFRKNLEATMNTYPEIRPQIEAIQTVTEGTDIGVKATMLGYDGYYEESYNYMVITNRTALVVLDNKGDWQQDREKFDMEYGAEEYYKTQYEY